MPRRSVLAWIALTLASLGAACAGGPSSPQDHVERRLALYDYRNARRFELVDEETQSRVDQYSRVRADANVKVLTVEIMEGMLEFLSENGFHDHARDGAMPREASSGTAWALELLEGSRVRHVIGYPPGLESREQQRLRNLRVGFLEIYNNTYSLQAVEVKPGESPFKAPSNPQPAQR